MLLWRAGRPFRPLPRALTTIERMGAMSSLVYRVAVLAISIVIGPTIGDVGRRAAYAAVGGWGFDLAGADFAINPGDDFFRYGNGAWYDHAVIPPDRSSIGVDTVLSITAEARIRDILERGQEGVEPSAQADAAKFGAFYAAFMDEARAEALDAEPIAPLLAMIRASSTHDQLADLMRGTAGKVNECCEYLKEHSRAAAQGRELPKGDPINEFKTIV